MARICEEGQKLSLEGEFIAIDRPRNREKDNGGRVVQQVKQEQQQRTMCQYNNNK